MRSPASRFRSARASVVLTATLLVFSGIPASAEPDGSLQEQLDAFAAGFAERAPEAMRSAFNEGVEDVRRLRLVETARNVGDAAPAGTLRTAAADGEGEAIDLASLWANGPVVVSFYRGGWCPYCNLQLEALERSLASIEGAGARLVAITPELPEKAAETVAKNELGFAVLTDPGNTLAREFGIVFQLPEAIRPIYAERIGLSAYNGDDRDELPLAATYVIDAEGVIRWAWLDADYRRRAEPANILDAVKALSAR